MGIVPIKRTNFLVKKMVLVPFFQTHPNHDNHVHPPKKKQPRCGRPYSDDKWGSYGLWLWCADRTGKRASEHQRVPAGREKDGLLHPTGCWCIKWFVHILIYLSNPSFELISFDIHRQDNPLYDVFTVRQHLMFFASLRGVSEQVQETRVIEVLRALGASARGAWWAPGVWVGSTAKQRILGCRKQLMRGCCLVHHSRHRLQSGGVDSNTEIKAKCLVPLLRFCGIFCILSWPKHHCYPLVIQHSYGTWPIYRCFLMIYILTFTYYMHFTY